MTALRICLGEDNHDVRQALKSLLRTLGHDVVCDVPDGQALVEVAMQTNVDLVITDLDMPVLDGLAAAEQITEHRKLPVILLSGHPDAEHVVVAEEPVTLRLLKPVSLHSLQHAIRRAMRFADTGA